MLYQTPHVFPQSVLISQISSQYQLIISQEGCPTFVNAPVGFSSDGFIGCGDPSLIGQAQNAANITYVVTCTNIEGSFDVTFLNSQVHVSSGLNCPVGQTTLAVPLDISPELPEDCILDSFNSGSGDTCG